jgi:hypothetical protein
VSFASVDFATCTDQEGETFDAVLFKKGGEVHLIEAENAELLAKLRTVNPEGYEYVLQLAELLYEQAPPLEALSA